MPTNATVEDDHDLKKTLSRFSKPSPGLNPANKRKILLGAGVIFLLFIILLTMNNRASSGDSVGVKLTEDASEVLKSPQTPHTRETNDFTTEPVHEVIAIKPTETTNTPTEEHTEAAKHTTTTTLETEKTTPKPTKKRPRTTTAATDAFIKTVSIEDKVIVGIVDEHNQVLQLWHKHYFSNGKKALPIVHIDAHSDGMSILTKTNSTAALPLSNFTFTSGLDAKTLIAQTHVNTFIPVAQIQNLIDGRVTWIKPTWENQPFQLQVGAYKGLLGKRATNGTSLCYKNHNAIDVKTGEKLTNTSIHDILGEGSICGDDIIDEQGNRWDVTEFETLEKKQGPPIIKQGEYILDIDQHFFASNDPILSSVLSNSEYGPLFALFDVYLAESTYEHPTLGHISKELCMDRRVGRLSGNDPQLYVSRNRELLSKFLQDVWFNQVLWRPETEYPRRPLYNGKHYDKSLLHLWCDGPPHAHRQLIKISTLVHMILRNVNFLILALLKNEYRFPTVSPHCHVNNIYGLCPANDPVNNNPTKEDILKNMKQLENFIKKRGKPSLVTIARSLDGYTPAHLHQFIETELLRTIQSSIPNTKLEYIAEQVDPSIKPKPLSYIDKADVEEYKTEIAQTKRKDFADMGPIRRVKLRGIGMVEKFAKMRNIRVSEVFHHLSDFLAWKSNELKMNPQAHKRIGTKKPRPESYCYNIITHIHQPELSKLQCYEKTIKQLQDDPTVHQRIKESGKYTRVNIKLEVKASRSAFERWGDNAGIDLIHVMDEVDAHAAVDEVHQDVPFIYEEKGCSVGKINYSGSTMFYKTIRDRHPEFVEKLVASC